MKKLKYIAPYLLTVIVAVFTSCASQKEVTVGGGYDEEKNQTDYFVLPYGSASMPEKWEKADFYKASKQQFFKNSEDVTVALSFGFCSNYEFNADKPKKGFEFVESFYKWESQYYVKKHKLNCQIVEKDSINDFIIWRLNGILQGDKIDNYILFGAKKCNVSNFTIYDTKKWTEQEKIDFLKKTFDAKEKKKRLNLKQIFKRNKIDSIDTQEIDSIDNKNTPTN